MNTKIFLATAILLGGVYGNSFAQKSTPKQMNRFSKLTIPEGRTRYEISATSAKTPFQVRINDVPLLISDLSGTLSFYANSAIMQSGDQKIEIISADPAAEVKVSERKLVPDKYIVKQLLELKGGDKSGVFTAEVPYKLEGWAQNKDLSNNEALKEAARKWFEKMEVLLKEKKGDQFMEAILVPEMNGFQTLYTTPEEANKYYTEWAGFINKGGFEVLDKQARKIEVVGNGKLLHLSNSNGQGGIAIKASSGQMIYIDIFLHAPGEGKEVAPILINFWQVTSDFRKV